VAAVDVLVDCPAVIEVERCEGVAPVLVSGMSLLHTGCASAKKATHTAEHLSIHSTHRLFMAMVGNQRESTGVHPGRLRLKSFVQQRMMGKIRIRRDQSLVNPLVAGSSPARPTT
jgi:hypothetical protein